MAGGVRCEHASARQASAVALPAARLNWHGGWCAQGAIEARDQARAAQAARAARQVQDVQAALGGSGVRE